MSLTMNKYISGVGHQGVYSFDARTVGYVDSWEMLGRVRKKMAAGTYEGWFGAVLGKAGWYSQKFSYRTVAEL